MCRSAGLGAAEACAERGNLGTQEDVTMCCCVAGVSSLWRGMSCFLREAFSNPSRRMRDSFAASGDPAFFNPLQRPSRNA
ncbi:hypothetical protein M3J09_009900 [Ascochyta lentis]